jgi:hypothetical protein
MTDDGRLSPRGQTKSIIRCLSNLPKSLRHGLHLCRCVVHYIPQRHHIGDILPYRGGILPHHCLDIGDPADLLFTVPAQVPFWTARQFEPLIVSIVLPLMYVPSYTGPWLVQGTNEGKRSEQALRRGFKGESKTHDAGELHELERDMREVWEDAESGSRLVLQQFLAWASNFPSVQKCLV